MHKVYTLKNGLRVVSEKYQGVNSVSVGVMIQNGSRNEEFSLNGISHFIEHMFFKGTNKRNAKEIAGTIEDVGGQLNAFTGKESTCYYIKNLYTHLDLSLEVLSDMLLNSTFDEKEIEREKSVIVEEINMNEDSPEDVLYDLHSEVAFKKTSLSYPVLGSIDKINSLKRRDIIDFISQNYTPYNSVISVCGRFEDEELEFFIEKYFGEWKSEKKYVPEYNNAEIVSGIASINKEIEQLHISLGIKGLPYDHNNSYEAVLLSNILGGGASSILFQKVREELGLCYNIVCYPQTYMGTGMINIYTGLGKTYGEKALEAIREEVYKFSKNGISKETLDINKEKIKASYMLGLESTSSKMFNNAKSILFKNEIRTGEEVMKKVDDISQEDIDFVLKECFGKGIINTSYVGPNVNHEKLNSIILN